MRTIFSRAMMLILIVSMAAACSASEPSPSPDTTNTDKQNNSEKPVDEKPDETAQGCATLVTAFTKETDTTYYMIIDPCWSKSLSDAEIRETYYVPFQQRVEELSGKPWKMVVALSSNYKSRESLDAQVASMKGTTAEIKLEDVKAGE